MSGPWRSRTRRRLPRARQGGPVQSLAIALAVIAAAAFITFYAFNQGLPFVHHFTLYTYVNNSVNVRSGDPVRIAGIDVGSVQGTAPAGRSTRIAFTVDSSGQPVHSDATLRIRDRLFLEGSYYLELDPGSPSAPILHDGGEIPQAQTATPVQFYQVLSTFDLATRTSLQSLLRTTDAAFDVHPGESPRASGAGALKAAIPQLTPTLKDVAIVSQALRGTQPGDLERLLASASQLTGTLAANSGQLADLVSELNRTSAALAGSDGALGQAVAQLDQTVRAAPAQLRAIDAALPPVAELAGALSPSLHQAPPILDTLSQTVRQLAGVVAPPARGRLLATLEATFQQFPDILRQLAVVFPITKEVTDCLQTHVIPLFEEQVPDGSLSTGRPVWQDFAHFLPTVAGASGSFDWNGPYTRVLAAAGSDSLTGGTLGTLPVLGQLVGTAPPGGNSLLGARPAWVGDLPASAFRPDIPCTSQPVPSLASPTAAADLRTRRAP